MLSLPDILNLCLALTILVLESTARVLAAVIVVFLPTPLRRVLNRVISDVVVRFQMEGRPASSVRGGETKEQRRKFDMDAEELITSRRYPSEEHVIQTPDGYFLTIFRIPRGRRTSPGSGTASDPDRNGMSEVSSAWSDESQSEASATASPDHISRNSCKPPVLLMHGFLENAEVWVAPEPSQSLAFILADAGFDVWLGNVRGCKYGYRHRQYRTNSYEFWKFGLDEMALYDLPAIVRYIQERCTVPGQPEPVRVGYVGFSQGTALAFAGLSIDENLANQIAVFVALAPSTRVHGLNIRILDTLVRCDPNIIYLLFGRRRLIGYTLFWRRVLPTALFVKALDMSTDWLFGWHMKNIAEEDKPMLYSHLYSYGSVRTCVHWFQVLANGTFGMYDDQDDGAGTSRRSYLAHRVPRYPLNQIRTPIALFYGGSDPLPDIDWLLSQLAAPVLVHKEPAYEHLDFQFAKSAPDVIYPQIVLLLRRYLNL